MNRREAKKACLNAVPVVLRGRDGYEYQYTGITACIYKPVESGWRMTVELYDKHTNTVVIAECKDVRENGKNVCQRKI